MNIEMINNHSVNRTMDVDKNQYSNLSMTDSRMKTQGKGYSLDITGKVTENNAAYGKEELKSAQDIAQMAGMTDVGLQRDYMAVMSNSMSSDDFEKLIEDGVNPTQITVEESVTNLDKIKITMAQAGITVDGFNDDLSAVEIAAVVNNAGLAQSIESTLSDLDLPVTQENVAEITDALHKADELEPITDEAMVYMLENDLEPTIENLYKAEYSQNNKSSANYDGAKASISVWDQLEDQARDIVNSSSVDDVEKGMEIAKWLTAHQVPVTAENIDNYEKISEITIPLDIKKAVQSMAVAMEDGIRPEQADLTQTESLYTKSVRIMNDFVQDYVSRNPEADIHSRRLLEEIRLAMTAEANLTLLRKGIQIDTLPLEEMVDKLKEAEQEFYRPVLGDDCDKKIDIFKETCDIIREMPYVPLKTVATISFSDEEDSFNLENIHKSARTDIRDYEKAGEAYETLMTAPRADMGDSIRKAFANVDDILNDLGFELNDINRKAVRTLGYASVQINRENIESVREATATVSRVVEMMSPSRILRMIKEGHNPINENLYDLEKSLSRETKPETDEKYSRFLWKMEKSGQVSETERDAYIGMYRLLRQIEKQDGKVIGDVLFNGQELTMQNMLSASRTNRHKNMDVRVDDDFGVLEEIIEKGDSISDQINKVFSQLILQPVDKEYIEEKLEETKMAAAASDEVMKFLEELDEPETVENILAAGDLINFGSKAVKKLLGDEKSVESQELEEAAEKVAEEFDDKESAERVYGEYLEKALEVVNENTENADKYVDVRQWSNMFIQLGFAGEMVKNETYDVPVKLTDGYASIHLTIKHSKGQKGRVNASFETEKLGRVNATFTLSDKGVDGLVVSDSREGAALLKGSMESFAAKLSEDGIDAESINYIYSGSPVSHDFMAEGNDTDASNSQLYKIAKAFITTLA